MRRQPPLRRLLALVGAARDFLASAEPPPVAGAILMLAAPDASHATKGGVDEEEGRASWWLFQFLAILLELVLGLFVFGRMRRSSAAKGAAWRSCIVGYLLIWPEIPLVAAAAATSVRDYAITKSSKIKTNESPSSSVQSLEQRRELSSYVMDDTLIRPTIIAWFDDRAAVEATYGQISTWDTSGVTDMFMLFCVRQSWMDGESWWDDCVLTTSSFNENIGAWDTSGVTRMYGMFLGASSFNQNIGGWNVANVNNMGFMFGYTSAFDQDIGGWNVANVRDMHYMFHLASAFDQDIGTWDLGRNGHVRDVPPRLGLQPGHRRVGHLWCYEHAPDVQPGLGL